MHNMDQVEIVHVQDLEVVWEAKGPKILWPEASQELQLGMYLSLRNVSYIIDEGEAAFEELCHMDENNVRYMKYLE